MPSSSGGSGGSNRIIVPEARHAINQMKLEIANGFGLTDYDKMDKGSLTSRQNGYIGGTITRTLVEIAQRQLGEHSEQPLMSESPEDQLHMSEQSQSLSTSISGQRSQSL